MSVIEKTMDALKRHEGWRSNIYYDSEGVATLGYGFNISEVELTEPVRKLWHSIHIDRLEKALADLPEYEDLSAERQDEINKIVDLPEAVAELQLYQLLQKHLEELKTIAGWNDLNDARKGALLNMHYNLGNNRFLKFKKMLAAIEQGNYREAASEMIDSKWARQVGQRAYELSRIIKLGVDA